MKNRTTTLAAISGDAALLLTGCGGEADVEPEPTPTETVTVTPENSASATAVSTEAGASNRVFIECNAFFEPDDPEAYDDDVTAWMRLFGPTPAELMEDVPLPSILNHELTTDIYEVWSCARLEIAVVAEPTDIPGRVGCRIQDMNGNEVLAFEKSEPGDSDVTCTSTAP